MSKVGHKPRCGVVLGGKLGKGKLARALVLGKGKLRKKANKKTWLSFSGFLSLGKGKLGMERNPKGKPLGDALAFIRGLADGSLKQKTWRDIQAETEYVPVQAWSDDSKGSASGFCGKVKIEWPKYESSAPPVDPTRAHQVIHGVESAIGVERKGVCPRRKRK